MLLKTSEEKIVTYLLDDYLWLIYFDGWLLAIICDNFMCIDDYLWLFVIILCAWIIICEYFVRIYKNYTDLCEFMQIYG